MSTSCKTCGGGGTVSGTKTWAGEMTPRHEKCPDCAPEPAPELSSALQVFVDDFAGGVCDATCADAFSRLVDHAAELLPFKLTDLSPLTEADPGSLSMSYSVANPPGNEWDKPTPEPEPVEDFAPEDTL